VTPEPSGGEAPGILERPIGPGTPTPPVRQHPDVSATHALWAHVHGSVARDPAGQRTRLKSRLGARVRTAAATLAGPAQRDDRMLIGSLIRAVEALAGRCDELSQRVADLERSLTEVVATLGRDLVAIRATVDHDAQGHRQPAPADDAPSAGAEHA
jgi:hypothetical protein